MNSTSSRNGLDLSLFCALKAPHVTGTMAHCFIFETAYGLLVLFDRVPESA